jgi:hypothetical protein
MSVERHFTQMAESEVREYALPSLDMYVSALKNRLTITEETRQNLEYHNAVGLGRWMEAVSLQENDRPPVKARINFGRRMVELSSDDELPEKITPQTPVAKILEADALYLAKLKFVEEMAPQATSWGRGLIERKKVEKQIEEIRKASRAVEGAKKTALTIKDVFRAYTPRNFKSAIAVAGLALAGCTAKTPEPAVPSPTEPYTVEVTPSITPTEVRPTVTPTETAVPTPTPEVFTGSPVEIASWPERYQNYFAHPDPATWEAGGVDVTDEQFDTFLTEIRRNYLREHGVEGVESMDPEELLWAMIEECAREKKEIILSVSEIIQIRQENAGNTPYMEYFNAETQDYARYGLWQTYLDDRDILHSPDSDWVSNNLTSFRYQASIFGREVTVDGAPSLETSGDLVGVVLLPGELGRGVLIRVKDINLQWHLGLYHVSESPVDYDETMRLCWVYSDSMHFTTCPSVRIGGLTLREGWMSENIRRDYMMENLASDWLQWPPVYIRVRTRWIEGTDPERNHHIASYEGWIHPISGLEIIDYISVAPFDQYHNDYDITPPFSPIPGS